jgi:hypothetical protein
MQRDQIIAAFVGGALGLIVSGYALVYAPMKANYDRNGCVWLICEGR